MNDSIFLENFKSSDSQLLNVARYFTKNHDDANELFQAASAKMYAKFHQFKPGTNFKAWGSTIIRNTFINSLRKKSKVSQTSIDSLTNIKDLGYADNGAIAKMTKNEIYDLIGQLPEKYKAVILLLIDGYSYKEIAEELTLPLGTVKSNIFSARKELNLMLNAYYKSTT